MLDFRRHKPARNYLARGEQRKLLGLALSVGLVLWLVSMAAQPDRWTWLWKLTSDPAGRPSSAPGVLV